MKINLPKLYFIGLSIFAVTLPACHKDKTDTSVNVNNLAGTYKLTAMSFQANNGFSQDVYSSLQTCEKNSIITLNNNQTYEEKDTCSQPLDKTGTWSLPSTSKIIIDQDTADIISFDGRNLGLSFTVTGGKTNETFTKQ